MELVLHPPRKARSGARRLRIVLVVGLLLAGWLGVLLLLPILLGWQAAVITEPLSLIHI